MKSLLTLKCEKYSFNTLYPLPCYTAMQLSVLTEIDLSKCQTIQCIEKLDMRSIQIKFKAKACKIQKNRCTVTLVQTNLCRNLFNSRPKLCENGVYFDTIPMTSSVILRYKTTVQKRWNSIRLS